MTTKKLEIHSENIFPIIKKWLYTDKEIFVRELISNSCDALYKLKILADKGLASITENSLRIDVTLNKEAKTIEFADTGIGMTMEEIDKYIAQIAFSGAEEFVEKYKSKSEKDQIIGHFGLGFYSSYMVAKEVEIDSLSYIEGAKPAYWKCDGSSDYTIEEGRKKERGTRITLHIGDDSHEFLEESMLKGLLQKYCSFLPYPIYFSGKKINDKEPLWIKQPSTLTDKDYLDFYRYLYPYDEDPLLWMHLNVDYPFHLQGILYFPKIRRDFDPAKATVRLFCNRVFVSENCKDIMPNYLTMLRGVIDSPDIPLNVSRSTLQMDKTVRQLSKHISKKVTDSLVQMWRTNKEKFIQNFEDLSLIIKLGCLEDEKFYERAKDILLFKTMDGEWTTVEEYQERNREKTKETIYYTRSEHEDSRLISMWREKGIEILRSSGPFDAHLMHFLEEKMAPWKFKRIDASIHEDLLDKEREKVILDAEGKSEGARLADFFQKKLEKENVSVEAKSLTMDQVPGMILIEEEQRRMRDYMMAFDPDNIDKGKSLFDKTTFVINTNNPLIANIRAIDAIDSELAKTLANEVFDLALLAQNEMSQKALSPFIRQTTDILEKLTEKLSQVIHKADEN